MYKALIVCNSRFPKDAGLLPELWGPKADGILLRDALTDPTVGLFERSEVILLPEAESPEIMTSIDDFFGNAEPDDTLLFYYSGHGRSRSRQLFLCAGNTRTQRLHSTAISGSTLSDVISNSFAQVTIIILDCCHSGVFKGGEVVDGLAGTGRFVIAATSATERANDAAHRGEPSPFTRALVDGLLVDAVDRNDDFMVDLDDLFAYLSGVKYDGHEPHRKFDGAGAVPIARRAELPAKHTTWTVPNNAAIATVDRPKSFLDEVAEGAALSEEQIGAFRYELRDDIADSMPSTLSSTEFLQRAGVIKGGQPTYAGVLLFGENPTSILATAMVRCVRFIGTRKTAGVGSTADLHGTVPELIAHARDFVARSTILGDSPTNTSAYSNPAYRYPMIAIREIIANAVVHRDYSDKDACVQVHIYDDRLEVISPGTWGGTLTVPDGQVRLGTLERQSKPRNFRLARILTWTKLVEGVGAGVPRAVADCRAMGSPEPWVMIRHGLITVTVLPVDSGTREQEKAPSLSDAREFSPSSLEPGRIAQILSKVDEGRDFTLGSGYRVTNDAVLTAAHVVGNGPVIVRCGFGAAVWSAPAEVAAIDEALDVAVLKFQPPSAAPVISPVRYGRLTNRPIVLPVEVAGFPLFKSRAVEPDGSIMRDLAYLPGTTSSLANLRSGTLEVMMEPPAPSSEGRSPWAGLSGAPIWAEGRIIGVLTEHSSKEGLGRLVGVRIERFLTESSVEHEALSSLLDLPDASDLAEVPSRDLEPVPPGLDKVQDLAPVNLIGRESELLALEAFCRGESSYAWWKGAPWTGKTALMAWFAMHPPSGVDVVSFFVTARIVGQSDGTAFTEALIEQLAWLLDESLSVPLISTGQLDQYRRRQLAAATRRSRDRGRRLLLIVDGLDEDSGPSRGLPSIASMLPQSPDEGLRVVVTSRFGEIPPDVPVEHPLRKCDVYALEPSVMAATVRDLANAELTSLLKLDAESRDVIGFIAASDHALTLSNLVELTGRAPYELRAMLEGKFGRTVASLKEGSSEQKLIFAHDSLRAAARELLGDRLMSEYEVKLAARREST